MNSRIMRSKNYKAVKVIVNGIMTDSIENRLRMGDLAIPSLLRLGLTSRALCAVFILVPMVRIIWLISTTRIIKTYLVLNQEQKALIL
jgi:hypothetical protein